MGWMDAELVQPEKNVYVFCQSPDKLGLFKAYWDGDFWYDTNDQEVRVVFWKEQEN